MPSARQDPYLDFNFVVEIDNVASAGFREAELPAGQIEVVAYREGTDRTSAARLLPGRVEYGPLVLRRGFAGDASLFQWWRATARVSVVSSWWWSTTRTAIGPSTATSRRWR